MGMHVSVVVLVLDRQSPAVAWRWMMPVWLVVM